VPDKPTPLTPTFLFANPAAYLALNHLNNCYPVPIPPTLIVFHTPLLDLVTIPLFTLQHHQAICPLMMLMTQTQMIMVNRKMTM
jgi:hypothetical protein